MVGSNISSGLGRFALCETLESRSLFSVTTGLDTKFGGGVVRLQFGGDSATAQRVQPLKNGQVLAAGEANITPGSAEIHAVLALFNADGTLAKSFDGDGKFVLPTSYGNGATDITALPDGNVLVSTPAGLVKIKTNGTVDTTFGVNGLLAKHFTARVTSDGKIQAFVSSNGTDLVVDTYDANGKLLSSSAKIQLENAVPRWFPDGRIYLIGFAERITLYTVELKRVNTFGSYGDNYLQGKVDGWLKAQGPWKDTQNNPISGIPPVAVQRMVPTRDGGFLVEMLALGRSNKQPFITTAGGQFYTSITVKLDTAGKFVGINFPNQHRSTVDFNGLGQFAGTFTFGLGDDVYVAGSSNPGDNLNGYARSGSAFYIAGATHPTGPTYRSYFSVARTPAIISSISGVLFNDNNGNGKQDSGETVNAGRTVYIDGNNNNQLDPDEVRVVTDSAGKYVFSDIGPGSYRVKRVLPDGFHVSTSTNPLNVALGQNAVFNIGSNNLPVTSVKELVLT